MYNGYREENELHGIHISYHYKDQILQGWSIGLEYLGTNDENNLE